MFKNACSTFANGLMRVDISTPKHEGVFLRIDEDNYRRFALNYGRIYAAETRQDGTLYAVASGLKSEGTEPELVERLVLPGVEKVGFRNGNQLDCRRANLCPFEELTPLVQAVSETADVTLLNAVPVPMVEAQEQMSA